MTPPPNDLLLTLSGRDAAGRRATLARGSDGVLLAEGEIPPDAAGRAQGLLKLLQGFPEVAVPETALAALGRSLADVALPPAVRAGLGASLAGTAPTSPVRLRIAAAADLIGLPWEFLSLGEASGPDLAGFLGLHARLRLVREPPPGAAAPAAAPPIAGPVRLLLAHADPRSPEYPALAHLAAEVGAVRAALALPPCRRAEVQTLADATPAALCRALREWRPHVLHLVGHGDAQATGGLLVMQGEREGRAALLYAEELAGWLRETSVRLTVLSACRTGAAIAGAARSLSAAGVPAVVAMQLPLRDAAAGQFARAFYAALLEPCAVEEALFQGRMAVAGMGADWGVPLLYQAGPSASPLFAPAQAPLPPTNVPFRTSEAFVGRDGMMGALQRVLQRDGHSAALIGMSGVGKTRLAAEYAHAQRADYPGGVFWVGARTTDQLTDDLANLGRRFFGAPQGNSAEEAGLWARDALARGPGPTLLVGDDMTAATDLGLLPPTGACRLLLTMQEGYLTPPGIRQFFLPMLEEADAGTLLGAADAAAAERAAAAAIAALVGGLPVALELVAGHVARLGQTFAEYHAQLAAAPFETLDLARRRFLAETGHSGAVSDVFSLSFRGLTATAQDVLKAAATFGPYRLTPDLLFETWADETRTSQSRAEFEEAVGELADRTLVTRGEDRRLTIHELMRTFARGQIRPDRRAPGVGRAAAALTHRLSVALEAGTPAARDSGRHEAAHADAVATQCRALGLDDALVPLLLAMGRTACEAGRFAVACGHFDAGLARLRAHGPDSPAAVPFLGARADARIQLKDMRGALADARAALSLARRASGRNAAALAGHYAQVGLCVRHLERFSRARLFYDRALALTLATHGRHHRLTAEYLNR